MFRRGRDFYVFLLLLALVCGLFDLTFALPQPLRAEKGSGRHLASAGDPPVQVVTLASGVTEINEALWTLAGVQQVSLLNIDLTNPQVRLGVVQAHDQLFNHGEALTSMAKRTGAIAGINGDFYEIHGTNDPLGMVMVNGQLWQSPGFYSVLGVTSSRKFTIGPETFTGSVNIGTESYPLSSVNRYGDAGDNHLRLYTAALGASLQLHGAMLVLLRPGANSSTTFTVASFHANDTKLPSLQGQQALVGRGEASLWLSQHLRPGDTVEISERIAPDNNLVQAIGGGPVVLKDGAPYRDTRMPAPGATTTSNPLTAVGVSKDGKHALLAVCNGRKSDASQSQGFTYAQMAGYLQAHGAYQAMIFDGGASSDLVARLPGQSNVSVLNTPSAGKERQVANGLFVYSTAPGQVT